jgi:hypothetical protein
VSRKQIFAEAITDDLSVTSCFKIFSALNKLINSPQQLYDGNSIKCFMRLEERFFCCLSIKRLMIICTLLIITLILQHKIISLLTARVYCVKFTLLMGKLQNMFMKFAKISRPLQDLCDK